MLTMTFLGVGNAFAKRNFHSNVLFEAWSRGPGRQPEPDDVLLVDFGAYAPLALHQLKDRPGFEYLGRGNHCYYPKLRRVFITHQHADHIGGLEELAFMNTFVFTDPDTGRGFKPQIISSINILMNLWDQSLKGGLSTIQGRYALLQDFFFIMALRPGEPGRERFTIHRRYQFRTFPTDHVQIERKYDWPSYGLHVTDLQTQETAFFSGDTKYDFDVYRSMMEPAGICFHDAQLIAHPSPVHALIDELRMMPAAIKRKTWLYHYGDNWDDPAYDYVAHEFAGFARQQERYVIFDG